MLRGLQSPSLAGVAIRSRKHPLPPETQPQAPQPTSVPAHTLTAHMNTPGTHSQTHHALRNLSQEHTCPPPPNPTLFLATVPDCSVLTGLGTTSLEWKAWEQV